MNNSYESRSRRIRRALARKGLALRMSPTKNRRSPEWGKFRVIDLETNSVVHGKGFDLTLEKVEAFACP
ncbi:MAG: hypothetical protein ACXWLD_04080 [Rhizomicrobium sp.]